jgi:hypothetical protein
MLGAGPPLLNVSSQVGGRTDENKIWCSLLRGAACGERTPRNAGGGLARIMAAKQPSHAAELPADLHKCRAATREIAGTAASHPTL